jgi:glycosyltransferase involved in cell wall biosynthesis
MRYPIVSAIIPTYNRANDVRIAVASAVGQAYPASALEIIVVDDGGSDSTAEVLRREFGDRIHYLRKPNGGVSDARNYGMERATGEYLALLDDDDEWRPTKIDRQVEVLSTRPELGMVVTDVELMDETRKTTGIFERRMYLPQDGWVLRDLVRNPAFVPASAMFRREVLQVVGGFNPALRTAEDLDFFLRVALKFQVAVIEEPLTRAMRGHGLSNELRTYYDYISVIERFIRAYSYAIDPADREAALFRAYVKNANCMLWENDFGEARRLAYMAALKARTPAELVDLGRVGTEAVKTAGARALRWMRSMIDRVELRPQSAKESFRFAWSAKSRQLDRAVDGTTTPIPESDGVGEQPLAIEPTP